MHRIDDPTAAPALPTPAAAGTAGFFTKGNPGTGTPATIVTDDWANAVQEEMAAVIEAAGIALSKTAHTQLLTALNARYVPRSSLIAPAVARSTQGVSLTAGYSGTVTVSFTAPVAGYVHATGALNLGGTSASLVGADLKINGTLYSNDSTTTSQSHVWVQPVLAGATVTVTLTVSAASATSTTATYSVAALFIPTP